MQRRNAQNPQAVLPNGGGPPRPTSSAMPPNGAPAGQNLTVPGQNRPRPMPPQMPGQPMPNGFRVPQMSMNGVPTAPMQGQIPLPNPALDVGLVTRAHQISQNQQAILRQQQGQLPGQSPQMHNSPPRTNGIPQPGFPMQNMMPPFNPNGNGVGTPPVNSLAQSPGAGQAGSPRLGQHAMNMPGNVSQVKLLEQQIMQKYPHATSEQVMRLIQENLSKSVHAQQQRQGIAQSAMNAAAGGSAGNSMAAANAMTAMNGMGASQGTPQLYAQRLRQQQENQQKAQQAQLQAANAIGNGQSQVQGNSTGNAGQGHAHRGSPPSVQNGS
jgi:chromatin modification-related protein VID21